MSMYKSFHFSTFWQGEIAQCVVSQFTKSEIGVRFPGPALYFFECCQIFYFNMRDFLHSVPKELKRTHNCHETNCPIPKPAHAPTHPPPPARKCSQLNIKNISSEPKHTVKFEKTIRNLEYYQKK